MDIFTKFTSVVINAKEQMAWATSYYNISNGPPELHYITHIQ